MRLEYAALLTLGACFAVAPFAGTPAVPITREASAKLRGGDGVCSYAVNTFNCAECQPVAGGGSFQCEFPDSGGDCAQYTGSSCIVCTQGPWHICGSNTWLYTDNICTQGKSYEAILCPSEYHQYSEIYYGGSCDQDACDGT